MVKTSPQSTIRPADIRMRPDLVCQFRTMDGEPHVLIKDPIRLTYHHYPLEDFFLLEGLERLSSFSKLQAAFRQEFEKPLTQEHFEQLLSAALRDRLIVGNPVFSPPSPPKKTWFAKFISPIRNPLAIRFPPWDLTRWIDVLVPFTRWVVSPLTLATVILCVFLAALIILTNPGEFQKKLPLANEFFASGNLPWLLGALALTKVLHELAHALTCRQWGAECHHVGVMLLVFTPCLYCDVSDSWMLQNKWKRIFIASAGILVEVFLASICTFLWWTSEPGLFNSLCLNVMFVCSFGTIIFNGNPLLKYDGYYILSDLSGVPNLWSRSRSKLRDCFDRCLFGLDTSGSIDTTRVKSFWLICFAVVSMAYRLVLILSILYFVSLLLKPYPLFPVVLLFGFYILYGVLIVPVFQSIRRIWGLSKQGKITPMRFTTVFGVSAALLVFLLLIPLPHSLSVSGFIQFNDAERVYVSSPGILTTTIQPSSWVKQGDVIATLEDDFLKTEFLEIESQLLISETRIAAMEALRITQPKFGNQIPTERENRAELAIRLANLRKQLSQMKIESPQDGLVIAARETKYENQHQDRLTKWYGHPLMPKNKGAFLEKGTLVCLVGDPTQVEGFALIPQSSIDLVRQGQNVDLLVGDTSEKRLTGTITTISALESANLPGDLQGFIEERFGRAIYLNDIEFGTMYLAEIAIPSSQEKLFNFESAHLRIRVAPRSITARSVRYLKQTFSFLSD